MTAPDDETLSVFVTQLDRKMREMRDDGESREAALAEASGRLTEFGGVKRYLRVPVAGWFLRRETDRAAEKTVSAVYGPREDR
jgi:hypothetical protein